ncbi:1-aminocyclopropane-1-carboxylate deaminase/D-cysteine desulfhydrase [Flavobacterium orientale]|uniref:1-aminocyclopropane-1-carboxylate deaminase n=1 Tax=Flavobacterium orientale TaxID=1756020 RepID=A0A916XVC3_9FLAO|nr:pyridoxal-phosphate dependent enzyme [Flavobacterium orientale]GGD14462.1 1-aminocyclopropane-1-carboxylate deaminase [Flavobacterium orientale]
MNQQIIKFKTTSQFVSIKRDDLIHPFVSGNKYRKLNYNLREAKLQKATTLLTFGGAFSNHIAAVAFAGRDNGLQTIGVIRGDELDNQIAQNPTLQFAQENGMQFKFVSRAAYRDKDSPDFLLALQAEFGNFYLLPEGGTNGLAVKGCEEILTPEDADFDYICCAVGTGGTISGIINSTLPHQKVLGFPALKGDFLSNDIRKFANNERWELITDYHFGGYAKVTPDLILFLNSFYEQTKIPLDPVYTGKMVFGLYDLIQKDYFPENAKILLIHTGGLQGIAGMNEKIGLKNWPKIKFDD